MWQILNYLFGWDYIYWENSADQGIERIRTTKNGEAYYYQYGSLGFIKTFKNNKDVKLWLTCCSDKYIKQGKEE